MDLESARPDALQHSNGAMLISIVHANASSYLLNNKMNLLMDIKKLKLEIYFKEIFTSFFFSKPKPKSF